MQKTANKLLNQIFIFFFFLVLCFILFCLHRIYSQIPCIMIIYTRTPGQISSIQSIQGRCFLFYQHFSFSRSNKLEKHKKSDGNKGRAYFWKTSLCLHLLSVLFMIFMYFYDFNNSLRETFCSCRSVSLPSLTLKR